MSKFGWVAAAAMLSALTCTKAPAADPILDSLELVASQPKELQLSAEQRKKLGEAFQSYFQKALETYELEANETNKKALAAKSKDEKRTLFRKFEETMDQSQHQQQSDFLQTIAKILKPEQMKRLKQILRQHPEFDLYSDPDVFKELTLAEAQKKSILEAQSLVKKQILDFRIEAMLGEAKSNGTEIPALHKATREKVERLLTKDQKTKLAALFGTPVVFNKHNDVPPKK